MAAEFSRGLAEAGHSVIAESAFGVGLAVMRGVLAIDGHVVALSDSGIDRDYPRAVSPLSRCCTIHGSRAHELGRLVLAVPGAVTSAASHAPNGLIQTGTARLVATAQDVLDELAAATITDPAEPIAPTERTSP